MIAFHLLHSNDPSSSLRVFPVSIIFVSATILRPYIPTTLRASMLKPILPHRTSDGTTGTRRECETQILTAKMFSIPKPSNYTFPRSGSGLTVSIGCSSETFVLLLRCRRKSFSWISADCWMALRKLFDTLCNPKFFLGHK